MAKEIEHKFLLAEDPKRYIGQVKQSMRNGLSVRIEQGYLSRKPVVRVRISYFPGNTPAKAFLTIKGKGCRVRDEFEYEIRVGDAKQLMKLCGKRKIIKTRHYFEGFEVDEFRGRHRGLWMAEIELGSPKEKLPKLPEWIGKEVTYDSKYTNASLAEK